MDEEELQGTPLTDVLRVERGTIDGIRALRQNNFRKGVVRSAPTASSERQEPKDEWSDAIRSAHEANYVGLALSGGGIRSATFNLGVLQGLAQLKLLRRIDYISTVSGGGYIGAWLVAWTKRAKSFAKVEGKLAANRVSQEDNKEPPPIRFLRVFSNYLTPKLGVFSGDTWAMIAIYLRNLILNLTIVLAVLAALLLMPRVLLVLCKAAAGMKSVYSIASLVVALLVIAFWKIGKNMAYIDWQDHKREPKLTEQGEVLMFAAAPLFLAAALLAVWMRAVSIGSLWEVAGGGAAAYAGISLVGGVIEFLTTKSHPDVTKTNEERVREPTTAEAAKRKALPNFRKIAWSFMTAACGGALAGSLYVFISNKLIVQNTCETGAVLTAGVPAVVGIFLLAGVMQIGLVGTVFPDGKREWWGRFGGWLLLWALVWLMIFGVALYFPDFIRNDKFVKATWKALAAKYLTPAWILTTLAGVLAGKSSKSGKPGGDAWRVRLATVGPYVFIAGLLCWLSWGIDRIMANYGNSANQTWLPCAGLAICAGVAVLMGWRVDINVFSMHSFYRNRLVRCYLGASHDQRTQNRFTGFDPNDDIPLAELVPDAREPYDGPYPILNTSLNLVKGRDLAWQERKAESFVMTPRYCGYDVWLEQQDSLMISGGKAQLESEPKNAKKTPDEHRGKLREYGFCKTENYAFPRPRWVGPKLGLAMAISGAAASPNMGFYSSPPVAFLLTIFNVRLGQWLGNPRHIGTSRRPTPVFGLPYLVNELLGGTDDEARYVYLSDGGHFDNMGLYELVKRRCGLIILCDAEADNEYKFEGLSNAIRKCRIDMGIDIELNINDIAPVSLDALSKKHCAVGTIHYERADAGAPVGKIIYFKASLTGDEPCEVEDYKKAKEHSLFPHESTVDQWFSESQFESYRELGYHEVLSSLKDMSTTSGHNQKSDSWSAVKMSVREIASAFAGRVLDCDIPPSSPSLHARLRETLTAFGFETSELSGEV